MADSLDGTSELTFVAVNFDAALDQSLMERVLHASRPGAQVVFLAVLPQALVQVSPQNPQNLGQPSRRCSPILMSD
jgi:hypothetical protein